MLSFFPAPYPDELWYSVLSRYFAYSGYFAKCRNNSVNRDLLGNRMRRYVPFYGTNLNNFLTQLPNNFIIMLQRLTHIKCRFGFQLLYGIEQIELTELMNIVERQALRFIRKRF